MSAEDWIVVLIAAFLCGISFYLCHTDMKKNNKEYKVSRGIIMYSLLMAVIVVAIALVLQLRFVENSVLHNIKRICVLTILWPIAYIDYKTYRIPNSFILFGLTCRAVLLPLELLFVRDFVLEMIMSDVIAALALLAATVICKICIKNSIGAGDIKLFVVIGIHLGMNGAWSAVFMSLIVSFFIAVYLLVRKKKSRKDSIPFGPAIALGTFISIYLSGM